MKGQFIVMALMLTVSSANAEQTKPIGAAFCGRSAVGVCHVEWKWLSAPGSYQVVQRLVPALGEWRNVEETPGTSVGRSAAPVEPGHFYRVRACEEPIIDSTCAASTGFFAPYQPLSSDEIPELLVSENGRLIHISKGNAQRAVPLQHQVLQYNASAMLIEVEDVGDRRALPELTAPARRWGAKNFDDWDELVNVIYDGYARAKEMPPFTGDPSQPPMYIVEVPEDQRNEFRAKRLSSDWIESMMIVYSPPAPRFTVTIAADLACKHCAQIVRDLPELNKLGIRVRVMAFPLAGPNSEVGRKTANVWCAADPRSALNEAVRNEVVEPATCAKPVVHLQYATAKQLGFIGSPTIVSESGEIIGGYLTPEEMLSQLEALQDTKKQQ